MKNYPYKFCRDYKKLFELLVKYTIVCIKDNKICTIKKYKGQYLIGENEILITDGSEMDFREKMKNMKLKFILPCNIVGIFDIFFKVKIGNSEEFQKIRKLLIKKGFNHLKGYAEGDDIYGIIVGRANYIIVYQEYAFKAHSNPEYPMEKVLTILT